MSSTAKKKHEELLTESNITDEQQLAIDRLYNYDESLLMLPVGFGKTMVAMTAIRQLIEEGVFKRCLVIAPLRVCELTWAVEHRNWEHLQDWSAGLATGDVKSRTKVMNSDEKIIITNFENAKWALENYKFDALLVDELTKLKGGGVAFKSIRKHRKKFQWVAGMTGTLVEEGLEHLYYQMIVIDGGETFGRNRQNFLDRWFDPVDYNRYKWRPKQTTFEQFSKMIRPLVYSVDGYEGLPEPVIDYKFVDIPTEAFKHYNKMRRDFLISDGDKTVTAANAAVMTGKLQQICAGFAYTEDDGALFIHPNKAAVIMEEIVREPVPVVCVYTFTWELEMLQKRFPEAETLSAQCRDDDATSIIDRWNAGEIPLLLLHPKSGGHGLNLQYGGSRLIFCGPLWSKDQTDQIIGRLNRRGQTDTVRVTFVVARKTVEDQVMIPRVAGKGDAAELFRRHLRGEI